MKKIIYSTLLMGISVSAVAQEWTLRTPMPTGRYLLAGASMNQNIYVFGGIDTSGVVLQTAEAYNISANNWKTISDMPTPRVEMFAGAVGKYVYVIGGFNYSDGALNIVEVYDPATDTWDTAAPMPTSRSQISGAVVGNKIYITGGWPSSYNTLEIYDAGTDSWTTGASAPAGIHQNNSGVNIENEFYFFGGASYGSSIIYDVSYAYNPVSDEWDEKAPMPETRFSGAAALYKEKLHYFGGSGEYGRYHTYDNHYVYDPLSNEWTDGIDMEENRGNMIAVAASDGVYVIGGYMRCDSCENITGLNKRYSEEGEEEPSSIQESKKLMDVSLYPNPATNDITVTVKDDNSTKKVSLVDVTGKVLRSVSTTDSKIVINTAEFPSGIYLLNIHTNKGNSTQKVSITR